MCVMLWRRMCNRGSCGCDWFDRWWLDFLHALAEMGVCSVFVPFFSFSLPLLCWVTTSFITQGCCYSSSYYYHYRTCNTFFFVVFKIIYCVVKTKEQVRHNRHLPAQFLTYLSNHYLPFPSPEETCQGNNFFLIWSAKMKLSDNMVHRDKR